MEAFGSAHEWVGSELPGDDTGADETLEQWCAASFPQISAPVQTIGLHVDEEDEFTQFDLQHCTPPLMSVGEHKISIKSSEAPRLDQPETEHLEVSMSTSVPGAFDVQNGGEKSDQREDEETDFVPKKLFSRRQQVEQAGVQDGRCCDQCHSDLNKKLLVRCSMCTFCRHLFCFSPPLTQHPAMSVLPQVPRYKRPPSKQLFHQWKCADCMKDVESKKSLGTRQIDRGSQKPPKTTPMRPTQHKPPNKSAKSPPIDRCIGPSAKPLSSIHFSSDTSFDWYEFRAEKFARVLGPFSSVWGNTGSHHELVYFSPSIALMRKTARFWLQYAQKRKKLRARHARATARCLAPVKRDVMECVSPRELAHATMRKQQLEHEEEIFERVLFDDTQHYRFADNRPIFQTLRRRPAVVEKLLLDFPDSSPSKSVKYAVVEQNGREEIFAMEAEDKDVLTPSKPGVLPSWSSLSLNSDLSILGLRLAARIIERACLHWLKHARATTSISIVDNFDPLQDDMVCHQPSGKATRYIRILRVCIQFLMVMMRVRRTLFMKNFIHKIQETSEELAVATIPPAVRSENPIVKTAELRIQRFCLHRVKRYIGLKRHVMARRIQLWCKCKYYTWKWCMVASEIRAHNRNMSARRIQHTYRQFRLYSSFTRAKEKHALTKIRICLRGWLMRRLIDKESDRVAIYNASLSFPDAAINDKELLVDRPDAPVEMILHAIGMWLYERSQFKQAADILERERRYLQQKGGLLHSEGELALAYSHHVAWYSSYDSYNLTQSYELYSNALDSVRNSDTSGTPFQASTVDAFLLQELALVLMHREAFGASLRILACMIDAFPQDGRFSLWLLLAGVQLQQVGQWEQSAEYLTYLTDLALPAPYLERDILALCAMSCERVVRTKSCSANARDAWQAAVRLWTLEEKQNLFNLGRRGEPNRTNLTKDDLGLLRRFELLADLGERSCREGHYLIACRVLLYAVEKYAGYLQDTHIRRLWWLLSDAFRHLGHLELYVEAMVRSQCPNGLSDQATDYDRKAWRVHAEQHASSFELHLRSVSNLETIQHIAVAFQDHSQTNCDLRIEDVEDEFEQDQTSCGNHWAYRTGK